MNNPADNLPKKDRASLGSNRCWPLVWGAVVVVYALGCEPYAPGSGRNSAQPPATVQPASLAERESRRAFDGAPPVIPHLSFGSACEVCHTASGKVVPTVGMAPANPHHGHARSALFTNCRQCHVFSQSKDTFAENDFDTFSQRHQIWGKGEAAHGAAPPVTPHPLSMRENCAACHTGPAARPEIRCSHGDRVNCVQCHVAGDAVQDAPDLATAEL